MIVFLNICCFLLLGLVAYQDIRDRLVYWWAFPGIMCLMGALHWTQVSILQVFVITLIINGALVLLMLSILVLYNRYTTHEPFLDHSLGIGDILIFLCLAAGFQTGTFIVILATSLLFSLLIYLFGKAQWNWHTVPLAGLIAIFLIVVQSTALVAGYPLI